MKTLDLVKMAMYLALFAVLDYMAATLSLFQMPNGGSLGLGAVVLLLAAYDLGWQKGLLVALVSIVIQMMVGPVYFFRMDQIFFDYILAFGLYGLAPILGLFPRRADGKASIFNLVLGATVTNLLRLLSHAWVGVYYWLPMDGGDPATYWSGSLAYQSSYMIPTLIFCVVLLPILYEALWPLIRRQNA